VRGYGVVDSVCPVKDGSPHEAGAAILSLTASIVGKKQPLL